MIVDIVTNSGCYSHGVWFVDMAPGMVGILSFLSDALGVGLTVLGDTVMANHEELSREMPGWSWSSGDGLGGAF